MKTGNYFYYLNTRLNNYAGEWVAIVDEKIVSHGNNAKEVYDKAKKKFPEKVPFLACVPKTNAILSYFAG